MATFGTFVAGQVLTAAELNTAGVWQDYTPSWTQSATITKTTNWARYTQLGKWVQGSVKMTATSAGTADNKILVGLPVSASSNNQIMGTWYLYDDSSTDKYRWGQNYVLYEASGTIGFTPVSSTGTAASNSTTDARFGQNYTDSGNPRTGFTIASGDIMYIQFAYEAS